MYQTQRFVNSINVYSLREYLYHVMILISFMIFLLANNSALAAVTCPADSVSDIFSIADYNKLAPVVSPPAPTINQPIDGNQNESYLIASNSLVTSGSLTTGSSNTYQSTTVGGIRMFEFFQDFATKTSTRTVSYTFKNKFTNQSQALSNLSLTLYDIDTNIAGTDAQNRLYFEYFDQTTITGVNSLGAVITPLLQSKGAGISDFAPYRQTNITTNTTCNGLDNRCRVTVAFNEPVVSVDITYGNNTALNYSTNGQANNDPGDQLINILFDGYCYLPQPRLTYNKNLSDPRKANTDQFVVQIKDNANNSVVTNGITTTTSTGTGNIVTNGTGTTGIFKVDPTKTYTLTETAAGSTNLVNYADSYICKRSDGTTVTTLNPKILKLTYGDNWTCTITNSKPNYTFTGTVFNDNGGIASNSANKQNISPTFTSNQNYFNGIFDSNEQGIAATGLQVRLTDCSGTNIVNTTAQTVSSNPLGRYTFNVPASALDGKTRVCIVEIEPSSWIYDVDTTTNNREVLLVDSIYNYSNIDFGEVESNNAALVLIKSQYLYDCRIIKFNDIVNANTNPSTPRQGFSTNAATDAVPGECIAYRIEAFNRGHIDLRDVQISDTLQTTSVKSAFFTAQPPYGIPENVVYTSINPGPSNGKIVSDKFDLARVPPSSNNINKGSFFFSTNYGTTNRNP